MKKIGFLLLAVFLTGVTVTQAQKKQYAIYAVAFYNLENLFDTINQPNTNDEEFTPSGSYRWGGLKYRNKLNNLAYAISNFATDNSSPFKLKNGPAVIGVSEIENEQVLEDLIHAFHPFPICEFPFALQGPRSPPPRILSGILIQNLFYSYII